MILEEPRLIRRGYVAAADQRWPDHVWIIMGTLVCVAPPEYIRVSCREFRGALVSPEPEKLRISRIRSSNERFMRLPVKDAGIKDLPNTDRNVSPPPMVG